MAVHSTPERLRQRSAKLAVAKRRLRASLAETARRARKALPAGPRTGGGSPTGSAG